jgi:hypothetical protein
VSIRRRVILVRNGTFVASDTSPLRGNDPETWSSRFGLVPSEEPSKLNPERFARYHYEDMREQSLRPFSDAGSPMRPWDELPKSRRDVFVRAATAALRHWYDERRSNDAFEVHVLVEEEP